MNAPTLGGSCQFDTTGFRSIAQLAGSLDQIRLMTGRGNPQAGSVAGIPLKFVLRPYRVQVGDKSSIQYGVSLEFRAKSLEEMARLLHAHAAEFRQLVALPAPASAIECEADSAVPEEDSYLPEEQPGDPGAIEVQEEAAEAAAMTGEFYGLFPDQAEMEPPSRNHVPSPGMPRRRSDTAHHEALA
jgi:hypothetical protein